MDTIINWCNDNVGFTEVLSSFVGIIVSIVAIVISIKTARLPYKKAIKLSKTFDYHFSLDQITKETTCELLGVSLNVVNTGCRDVNITFLGLGIKKRRLFSTIKKMVKIKSDENNTGVLKPTEISSVSYDKVDILANLEKEHLGYRIYIVAIDSEGKIHQKYIDKVKRFLKDLDYYTERS